MSNEEIYNNIKSTAHSFLPEARVLLFGSRARGNYDKFSDFDLLVITKKTLSQKEKINWYGILDKALVQSINAPVDIILDSEEEVIIKKELPGHIVRWAVKEGIAL